ncbi:MAG: alpha/beta hydrolase [Anaerolineaceae bacterium]|nr:alpha/beta hydrolase [Anaerolineaceae bacterium]
METTRGLYFEAVGAETTPVIVFLHGGGAAGWMWRKVAAILQGQYRCLLVDLPEQGNSTRTGPFSHELAADLTADLIREQAGGKAHVVGLSEGAQVVVELLSRQSEVVDHAVISSAILRPIKGAGMMSSPGAARWSYRLAIAPFKNWDGWIRLNMRYSAGIPDKYFADFKRSFQQTTESGFVNILSAVNYRMPAGLERAQAPCLVVVGDKEYREMQDSARDLLGVLPNSRGAVVSLGSKSTLASEHNWAMTAPEVFAKTVAAWIEGRSLPDELGELSDIR